MDIPLSAPDWCFFRPQMVAREYYETLRQFGYTAVEMVAEERFEPAIAAGLEILDLAAPGMMEGLNRRDHHPHLVPAILDTMRLASENQIPAVIVFSGNRDGQEGAAGLDNVAAGLEALLPHAAELGVELWFEMLCQRDHPDYQADRAAYGFELHRRLGRQNLRILYDVYHMSQMAEDVESDLTGNIDAIGHIHLADLPKRGCPREGAAIDFRAVRDRALEAGYAGHWGMEFIPGPAGLDEAREAAEWLRG